MYFKLYRSYICIKITTEYVNLIFVIIKQICKCTVVQSSILQLSTSSIFSGNKQKATDDVHRFELVYNLKYYF